MTKGRFQTTVARLAIVAAIFALWEVLARTGAVQPRLLPPASDVFATVADLLRSSTMHRHLLVTGAEVAAAFALAAPFGLLVGLVASESRYLGEVLKPFLFFLFSIPKSIFLPMFILAFGISFAQKVAFGFVSTCFIVIMSTIAAVESVREDHVTVARSFGATPAQIIARVYLPSMLPIVLEALRIAMIFNFTGVILAEMYASREGVGYLISNWGENFQIRQLLAGVIIVAALAIGFNEMIRSVESRCGRWRV